MGRLFLVFGSINFIQNIEIHTYMIYVVSADLIHFNVRYLLPMRK